MPHKSVKEGLSRPPAARRPTMHALVFKVVLSA